MCCTREYEGNQTANFFDSWIVKQTELQILVAILDTNLWLTWVECVYDRAQSLNQLHSVNDVIVPLQWRFSSSVCHESWLYFHDIYNNFSLRFVLFFIFVIVLNFKLMKANCFIVKKFSCNLCDLLNFLCFLFFFFVFRVISSYMSSCLIEPYRCCIKLNKCFECFPIILIQGRNKKLRTSQSDFSLYQ